MKRNLLITSLLLALGSVTHGQFTTDLRIVGTGLTVPAGNTDFGKSAILDYTIDAGGLLSLNHNFANSGNAVIGPWGDALDFIGAAGLSAGANTGFGMRIYGVVGGADGPVKSLQNLGMGVGGFNNGRMEWGSSAASSESFRFEITTTNLPSTLKVVITAFQFGNANAIGTVLPEGKIDSLVNVSGFAGGVLGSIPLMPSNPGPHNFAIPDGGLSIVGGGGVETKGIFVLSQATQPASGSVGFSLQGFTFDVVPVTPVPEPSTVAIYAGLAVLGLALWRRGRRS